MESKAKKFVKIKYTINILPVVTFEDGGCYKMDDLMGLLGETDEMEIFETKVIQDFFDFQWNGYAKYLHYFGGLIHLIYVTLFAIYINQVYLDRNQENKVTLLWMMLISLIYPMVYDCLQFAKQGIKEYCSDVWNFLDQAHIWLGFANIFI